MMSRHEALSNGENTSRQPSKFEQILGKMPNFFEHMKKLRTEYGGSDDAEVAKNYMTRQNRELQVIYDLALPAGYDDWEVMRKVEDFNCTTKASFLASGQSSYFSEQIDKNGMSGLRLRDEDIEDAKYIAECFGKQINLSNDALDILYVTLPGTTEVNYATQTFPAVIFEDVFQCSATHELPFPPKVGEKEEVYWSRVLSQKISEKKDFPADKVLEAKTRGVRLAHNFCKGKNRIYLIPIEDIDGNKASFGDVAGLRDGMTTEANYDKILQNIPSFKQLADENYCPDVRSMYQNPNFTSEYGIAIYGKIQSDNLEYVEVDRSYDFIQKKALQAGLKDGDDLIL